MSVQKFSPLQRVLHWTMSAAIFLMLFIGIGMVSIITPAHLTLLSIHKPLGIAILILVIVRLIVRLSRGTPPLPSDLPPLMKFAAHASHWALYALMIAMPLIGWGMLSAAGDPVVVAGIHLPSILPMDGAMHGVLRQAHTWLALVLFALVLAHLAAALFHALVRRDGVFESMA
jgi:cytochrome b561